MFFAEARRKYFNIIFLFVIITGIFWLYSSLKPTASTNYDYYKYNYSRPLNEAEFVYFELVSDYKKGIIEAYSGKSTNGMANTYQKILNNIEKEYLLDVIKKINPSYKSSEKMNNVKIDMSYSDMSPYLKELEEKLSITSLYYTGMTSGGDSYENMDYIYNPVVSPYWIYKYCTLRFHGKEYKEALKDFNLTYQHGISNGYAYLVLDSLGIIMGVITIIYSFMSYSEEKRTEINGYVYTGNISSVKYVLYKYFADTVPLMFLSIIYSLFGAACFMYWNYKFNYGYNINVIPFLIKVPFIIFPLILILAAIGHLLGSLLQSGIVALIVQFVLFYLSMGYAPGDKFNLFLVIRYNNFDDYSFYQDYSGIVILNRIIITIFSIVLTGFVIILFSYRREHGRLINLKIIKNSITKFLSGWYKDRENTGNKIQHNITRGIGYYIFKQAVNKTVLLYIPYVVLVCFIIIFEDMNEADIATAGENIFIFASLFLFIRLGNIEQENGTEDYVFTSNCFYPFIYMSRVVVAGIILFIMLEMPVLFLCLINNVPPGIWCIGVYCSTLFIGIFALLITEISGNYVLGYFSYIIYYLFCMVLREGMPLSITGYTYHMQRSKLYLVIAIIVVFIILPAVTYLKQKGIRLINRYGNRNQ